MRIPRKLLAPEFWLRPGEIESKALAWLESAVGRPANKTSTARAAEKILAVHDELAPRKHFPGHSLYTPPFVKAVVDTHMMSAGRDRTLGGRIKKNEVGVASYGDCPFFGEESEHSGWRCRDELYEAVRLGRPKTDEELIELFRQGLAEARIHELYQHELYEQQGVAQLRAWRPDLLVVAAYGQILKADVLAAARHGGINVHGSLLPKYRGAAPVAWAILRGEATTGVTSKSGRS